MPKKPLIHSPRADTRGTIAERLERIELSDAELRAKIPTWIAEGVLAASEKIYQELYDHIAGEHARVFEVQEAGFMAVVTQLDRRLRVIEDTYGLASPPVAELRMIVDAIAEYTSQQATRDDLKPWRDLSPLEQADVIGQFQMAALERAQTEDAEAAFT